MNCKIALAGNPNCGKTTLFNALTGATQYVGNWPGVTVEKKEGRLKGERGVVIQDLPGIYSLSPYTLEEVVSRNYLVNEKPDAILNIVDASNLERNLYLTTQLLEVGVPVVVALNMMDVVQKNGMQVDAKTLQKELGVPVVEMSAVTGAGVPEAAAAAMKAAQEKRLPQPRRFEGAAERAVEEAEDALRGAVPDGQLRWWAVKAIERDEKALGAAKLPVAALKKTEALSAQLEKTLDDDAESIITGERYAVASAIMEACASKRAAGALSASDKIDRIVTNRWLALPIFVAVMFGVYYLSVTTVGTMMTDWVNDVLFGEIIPPAIESFLVGVGCAEWLQSLVLDGIVAGVGAVLGFLPQMMVLFLLLAILEDCGYMARIAFIMDRIFRRFGLSGKSFIPMLIGTGCGVPAVMGSRTIENDRDRKLTIMTTTFIPCSAKVPIIGLIAGALFGGAWWVAPSAYFVGVAAIVCSGIILKKTKLFAGDPAPFVMELPAYHIPRVKGVLIHMWDRSKAFVKKAGSVIFLSTVLIWLLSSFNWRFEMVEESESMLAAIGSAICFIFAPLGWGDWRATVAAFTGLIAKENVVGTFGILYGFGEVDPEASEAIWSTLASSFSMLSAYSFLVFNLLCAPCFAAIGAIRREMGSGKWTWIAIGWQCGLAYAVSLMIYQIGSFVTGGGFGLGTAVAIALLAAFVWLLVRPDPNAPRRLARTAAARANG